ncbi:MAG TPA: FtsX-like permease family protein [Solirubrobacteraceae bacterium]|jgi:putative ABC transport system permease protein|nr:FtsX-like permease family protein [Solirubrobacteraceae bacterium]
MARWEILYLYRARLRARLVLVQELLAVLGIAVGVALLFASQVASTSLDGSIRQLTGGVVGSASLQLVARDAAGFDQRLANRVRALPGVIGAEPVLEARATVIGPRGRCAVELIAGDPRYVRFGGSLLAHFDAIPLGTLRVVALPTSVAHEIGVDALQPVGLELGARRLTVLMGATLDAGDIGPLVGSPVAIAPLRYAQEATGLRGRVTRIVVQVRPGHQRSVRVELQQLAAGWPVNVVGPGWDARLFEAAAAPADQSEALFSAISALVGFMFAFSAMLVTVQLRRNLVETLRRRGATRAMIVQVLAFDALVLGVLGTLLGLALGEALSIFVFGAEPGYLAFAFAVGEQRIVTWQSLALASAAGMAAAAIGVLAPLGDAIAGRLRASDVLGNAHGRRRGPRVRALAWRGALGAGCLALTTAILLARPQSALLGAVALVAALLLLLPAALDAILAIFERLQRPLYAACTRIALVELRTKRTRTRSLAIAATGAVAVFGSVAIDGAADNLQRGLGAAARAVGANAAVWVSPQGPTNAFTTIAFPATARERLERLPGVRAVQLYRGSFLDWDGRRVWVLAPPRAANQPVPTGQLVSGGIAAATAGLRGQGWAVVSQALAATHGLRIGQRFTLPAPRPTTLRVAALSTNLGWPSGAVVMSGEQYARAWDSNDPSAYLVQVRHGVSPARVRAEIQRALGVTGLVAETAAQRVSGHYATTRQALSRLTQIGRLVLIAAVLAMAGAMGSMVWQRRPQLAYIKRQGYKRGVLWRALLWESALLLGAGCSLGALFGIYGQLLLSHALATVTGFPVIVSAAGWTALGSFALVSAAAVAILALPGYLAVGVSPTTVSAG